MILETSDTYRIKNKLALTYYRIIKMIATSKYKWVNLPNGIPGEFIEESLFLYGKVAFYDDSNLGLIACNCIEKEFNIYNQANKYDLNSNSLYHKFEVPKDEIIMCRNNIDCIPTEKIIMPYCERLAEIEISIQINLQNNNTPFHMIGDEKTKLSLLNIYKKIAEGHPLIITDEGLNMETLKVLDTKASWNVDKLQEYKNELINELLTYLGINNNQAQDKKERLIVDEVNVNNDFINTCLDSFKYYRDKTVEALNEKYGLNIKMEVGECQKSQPNFGLLSKME